MCGGGRGVQHVCGGNRGVCVCVGRWCYNGAHCSRFSSFPANNWSLLSKAPKCAKVKIFCNSRPAYSFSSSALSSVPRAKDPVQMATTQSVRASRRLTIGKKKNLESAGRSPTDEQCRPNRQTIMNYHVLQTSGEEAHVVKKAVDNTGPR